MAKVNFIASEKDSKFIKRFKELCGEHENCTSVSRKLADNNIFVTRQTITNWLEGKTTPDHATAIQLAQYFGVSLNWLLGISDIRTPTAALEDVCRYTGLTLEAVEALHKYDADHTNKIYGKLEKGAQLRILSQLIEAKVIQRLADHIAELEQNSKKLLSIDSLNDTTYHDIDYLNKECDVNELKISKLLSHIEKYFDERERQNDKYNELLNKASGHQDEQVTFDW